MLLSAKIETRSSVPIPAQLRAILLEEIRNGRLAPARKLPSERTLAERFRVSRTSVRESLNALVQEGLLVRSVGKGTFVAGDWRERLVERKPGSIAFLISENIFQFVQPGYNKILLGAQQACRQAGFQLLFHAVSDEEHDPRLALPDPGGQLDACIVAGGLRRKALERVQQLGIPVIFVDLLVEDDRSSFVGFDYAGGTHRAVEYLAGLGHREIGFIGFPNSEKFEAYWRALDQSGLRYDPHYVKFLQLPDVQPSILAGFRMMQQMIAAGRLPTAVIATNDLVAIGVMEALGVAGLAVPGGMSVVGYDDLGQEMNAPLTTIRSNPEEAGRLAVQLLLERLRGDDGREQGQRISVPTELIVRGTTGPPHSR